MSAPSITPPTDALGDRLRAEAAALGFGLCGVTRPEPSAHLGFYRAWLAAGRHGEMRYLDRPDAVERRADLTRTMPEVRSVVVVGLDYHAGGDEPDAAADPARGVIARYARGRDYHKVLKQKLLALAERVERCAGRPLRARAYVDTGPILERDLARRAGLGWFGRSTMLIHPRRGSWFFLGVLLLDLDLEPDAPFDAEHCGSCTRCVDACPTGALQGRDASGAAVIDATRCISYLTIESRGPIPRELRAALGSRIYGCDICQEVCPFNGGKFVPLTREPDLRPRPGTVAPALLDLIALDEGAWDAFTRGSPIRRAGRAGLLRNVAVALGNWGSDQAVPALTRALDDDEPLVRGHAAWALGRIGTKDARAALNARMEKERDGWVREELESALAPQGAASIASTH
jgi:epoxyqueuosine reductase